MFVLKLKEVDGVQVPHVRPVVTEYHGTGQLLDEELYTPGMLHDTWRILLCIFLSFLVKGVPYSSVLIDFKRAFLKGDQDQARQTWRDIPPFFVTVPAVWRAEIKARYLRILKGLEGLRSSPIIWRKSLEKFLKNTCGFSVSPVDPCLFQGSHNGLPVFASLHGDDLHLIGPPDWVEAVLAKIQKRFELGKIQHMVENEPMVFCGMQATLFQAKGSWFIRMEGGKDYPQQIVDALQEPITQARCATIRGMLAWLASICAPDLLVLSRLTDSQLVEVGAESVVQAVMMSPPLILGPVDLYKPLDMVLYVDSSMDNRKVTEVRGRAAALVTLEQDHTSLVTWYSRLQNRVTPSSDIAECRAICEGLHTPYQPLRMYSSTQNVLRTEVCLFMLKIVMHDVCNQNRPRTKFGIDRTSSS
eukprot:jgi/Mesvir1/2370/Mv26017-RA.1